MASLCAPKDSSKKRAFENSGSEELPSRYEFLMEFFGEKKLLEVFSVVMDNKGEEARFISGTISVEDYFLGPSAIFSPERDHPVTIKPKGRTPLLLNGPFGGISARDDIEVAVKLKDEVSGKEFDGYITLISRSWIKPKDNKPLTFRCNMDKNVGEPTAFSLENVGEPTEFSPWKGFGDEEEEEEEAAAAKGFDEEEEEVEEEEEEEEEEKDEEEEEGSSKFVVENEEEEEEDSSKFVVVEEEEEEEEEGSSMFVEVKLAVLSYAAPVVFEVKLIKHSAVSANGNANVKVYGRISAFSECFGEGCESVLFDQERPSSESNSESDSMSESEGGTLLGMNVIPLSRSVVAVPAKFNHVIVVAELYDGDGKEIARGRAKFSVIPFSIIKKNISGEFGEIRVKVTWQNDPVFPARLILDSDV